MNTNYFTDDGHYWNIEDLTQHIIFMLPYLREQNYSDTEIIRFDNNEMWQKIARHIISASNKEI
jgi:hypothetical protein